MILRSPLVGLVVAAFVAKTAVPGPQVVAHRHARGEHAHVHGFVADDHPHDHGHGTHRHAPAERPRSHGDGLVAWGGEPGDHVHVVRPFQPATGAPLARLVLADLVTALEAAAPVTPAARPARAERSRGPPPSAHV